jgi:LacI family transcriptional regulator
MQALPTLEGTSVATAGRALGGYGKVAPVTRDRILGAARELNYYANALARSMKQRSGLTIGLIVGNICNSFFSTVVRAIESTVIRHGYKVIVCNTVTSVGPEKRYFFAGATALRTPSAAWRRDPRPRHQKMAC